MCFAHIDVYTSLALVDLARHPVHHTIECEAVARE